MEDNIKILLDVMSNDEMKSKATNNIINIYDLMFSQEQILDAFEVARHHIWISLKTNETRKKYEFLFNTLLDDNKNMFVAIIKMLCDKQINNGYTVLYVGKSQSYNIGFHTHYSRADAISAYKKLLNYNDFEINNLEISSKCKIIIQEYRDTKYGGKFIKSAIKFETNKEK